MRSNSVLCLSVLLLLFAAKVVENTGVRDVCIVGGGIGGFSVAVFLKDRGYNPIIFEKEDIVGGNCNTVNFPVSDPSEAHAIDIGAIAFANTTFLTQAGFGGWTVDSAAFFERFVGADGLIPVPIPLTAPVLNIDFTTGQEVTPPAMNLTEFEIALNSYIEFLATNQWFNTFINKPDPIPAQLLVPFDQFIAENNWQSIVPLFRAITAGGTTNYSSLSAWEAIRMACNIEGLLSLVSSGPNVFSVKNGCYNLYEGMTAYLGAENVLTNVNLVASVRPPAGFNFPTVLAGTIKKGGIERPLIQTCEKVFVAFPQLLDNLESFLELDETEAALFSKVKHFNYYVTSADIAGPLTQPPGVFVMQPFQEGQPFGLPVAPTLVNMLRGYSYGPATVGMTSADPIPLSEMLSIAQTQLDRLSPSVLTSAVLSQANAQHHVFEPYFPTSELRTSPDAYTRLNNLQGHRNTYYSGSLLSTVSHVLIINWADGFVAQHFPPVHKH